MSVLRESDDGRMSRGAASCHASSRGAASCHASCAVVLCRVTVKFASRLVRFDCHHAICEVRGDIEQRRGSGVFLGLETSELCWRGPEREGSAQLGRRGVAAGEEGVLLGAENRIHY